ncbi:RND family efflux transporter MFP subunit [Dysgonomonadaceae bacterium PH5-43]|nr:RND family efflux transporter MFP subunit [Dysgonomonadaceae bacterium PH5-43]
MDIQLKKKHWIVRYKYYLIGGGIFIGFLIYLLIVSTAPRRLSYDVDKLEIIEVTKDRFMEYLDVEGIVQPKMTIRVNSNEAGTVDSIITDNGSLLKEGDIIMTLKNIELQRVIEEERDELAKVRLNYREKEIQMKQKITDLKRQNLETIYNLNRQAKEQIVNKEEYNIGIKSKAQYELATEDYEFNKEKTKLLQEGLTRDSILNTIQLDLLRNDLSRAEKRFARSLERLENLVVRAPIDGQLSSINVIPGEKISAGSSIGELKIIDEIKISTRVNEYYIDRVTLGLPATITYQGEKFPLKITRINPEIKDRQFEVDLLFTDKQIENIRIGKSYRLQIELEQPEEALVVSKGNFFQVTGGQWVFKVNDSGSKAIRVPISIGRQNPRQYEILEGLQSGDKIIVSGYDNFGEVQEIILK